MKIIKKELIKMINEQSGLNNSLRKTETQREMNQKSNQDLLRGIKACQSYGSSIPITQLKFIKKILISLVEKVELNGIDMSKTQRICNFINKSFLSVKDKE